MDFSKLIGIYTVLIILYVLVNTIIYFSKISNHKYILDNSFMFFVDTLLALPIVSIFLCNIINFFHTTLFFLSLNVFILLYFFLRTKIPGKSWELILTNKHKKNLDTFMVVISLIFASAFGAITSFKIETEYFDSIVILIGVIFVFVTINMVILVILVVLSTFVINTMGNRKPIMMSLVILIGISLLIQETLNFNYTYNKYIIKLEKAKKDEIKK